MEEDIADRDQKGECDMDREMAKKAQERVVWRGVVGDLCSLKI